MEKEGISLPFWLQQHCPLLIHSESFCVGGKQSDAALFYVLDSAGSVWPSFSAPSCWSPASGPATGSCCAVTPGRFRPHRQNGNPWSCCWTGARSGTRRLASHQPNSWLLFSCVLCSEIQKVHHLSSSSGCQGNQCYFSWERNRCGCSGDSCNYSDIDKRGENIIMRLMQTSAKLN